MNQVATTTTELVRAEIDQAISTAKAYPRSIQHAVKSMVDIATMDEQTAAGMTYALPRDGKEITGPSVRLAEVAVSCWGNLRAASRVIEINDTQVIAEGACHDLESNTQLMASAAVQITGRNGRYSESMIQTACMAAQAKAFRNAVFKVIPGSVINTVLKKVQEALEKAAATDMATAVPAMIESFKKMGVEKGNLARFLGIESMSEIQPVHLVRLKGVYNSLKDGYMTPEDIGIRKTNRGAKSGTSIEDLEGGEA